MMCQVCNRREGHLCLDTEIYECSICHDRHNMQDRSIPEYRLKETETN